MDIFTTVGQKSQDGRAVTSRSHGVNVYLHHSWSRCRLTQVCEEPWTPASFGKAHGDDGINDDNDDDIGIADNDVDYDDIDYDNGDNDGVIQPALAELSYINKYTIT